MKGKGFEAFTEKGKQVKAGDKLLTFDNELIKANVKSNLSVLVVTNNQLIESIDIKIDTVDKNDEVLEIKLKK
ncbi:MAG TPA: PTS glucose transporter subunit IIA [Clostridium sp.]